MKKYLRKAVGEIVNPDGVAAMNLLCVVGDVNGDGLPDIVIAPRSGRMVWFENPGGIQGDWPMHLMDHVRFVEAGGVLYDLTGSGYPDFIAGGDFQSDELSWWENPGPEGGLWKRRVILKTGKPQFHDQLIGDVTNDGRQSLVFWNQGGQTLYWVPLPQDPTQSPWPDIKVIATGYSEEGLAIGDIDGDGKNELISGNHWYKYIGEDRWEAHPFAQGYVSTRVEVGDINGDGQKEILLAEGDAHLFGKHQGGKLAWFKPKGDVRDLWEEHVIDDLLQDPHSLQLGDFSGNGHLDVFVGEIGIPGSNIKPRILIYENDGKAHFTRHVIDDEVGTHEAKAADLFGRNVPVIVGKPLYEPERWKIHIWFRE